MADHEGHSLKKPMSCCINCFVTVEIQKCPGLIALNNSLMWYLQIYYIKWIWRVFCLRKVCCLILTQKHFKNNAWKKMRLYMLGKICLLSLKGVSVLTGVHFLILEFVFLDSVAKGDYCLPAAGFPNTSAMSALRGFQITSSTKLVL